MLLEAVLIGLLASLVGLVGGIGFVALITGLFKALGFSLADERAGDLGARP